MTEDRPEPRRRKPNRRVRWSDGGAFGVIPEWVLRADVAPRSKLVYGFLALYAGAEDATFRGKRGLAEDVGCGATALDKTLVELREIGAITVIEREGENGARLANGYVVHVAPVLPGREGGVADAGGDPPAGAGGLARGRDRDPEDLDPPSVSEPETGGGVPKKHLVDGRDLGFDALARVCGVDPRGARGREVGAALYGGARTGPGIRALVWTTVASASFRQGFAAGDPAAGLDADAMLRVFEEMVVTSIETRARAYRRRFRDAEMTPLALAKWFADLNYDPPTTGIPGASAYRRDDPEPETDLSDEERAANAQRAREALDRLRKGPNDDD